MGVPLTSPGKPEMTFGPWYIEAVHSQTPMAGGLRIQCQTDPAFADVSAAFPSAAK